MMMGRDPNCPVGLEYGNHPVGVKNHSYGGGPTLSCTCTPPPVGIGNRLADILSEVYAERAQQDAKWGDVSVRIAQGLRGAIPGLNICTPLDTGPYDLEDLARLIESWGRESMRTGEDTVAAILAEEVGEALAEAASGNREQLRTELIQLAAVAVFWVELLDRGGAW